MQRRSKRVGPYCRSQFSTLFLVLSATLLCSGQSCSVSKESIDVTVTRGMLWSEKVYLITLAFLHKFVYEFRGNNTYIIQDKTVLVVVHLVF